MIFSKGVRWCPFGERELHGLCDTNRQIFFGATSPAEKAPHFREFQRPGTSPLTATGTDISVFQDADGRTSVRSLLEAMGRGDRRAAAEFVVCYGPQIRRRIRGKLRVNMRRLFDSQDILSTLGRRLDAYVHRGQFEARSEGELWNLVFTIAERSVAEKAKIWRSLTENDSGLVRQTMGRLGEAERFSEDDLSSEGEFEHLLQSIPFIEDRQIARLWATGHSSEVIASELGLTPGQVRKRWSRVCEKLREQFVEQAT